MLFVGLVWGALLVCAICRLVVVVMVLVVILGIERLRGGEAVDGRRCEFVLQFGSVIIARVVKVVKVVVVLVV